ncbi:MAG: hypothetical protein ACO1SV_03495 [Fimbriimonas sp.]
MPRRAKLLIAFATLAALGGLTFVALAREEFPWPSLWAQIFDRLIPSRKGTLVQ